MNDGDRIKKELDRIRGAGLYRTLRTVSTPPDAEFVLNDRKVINFSSNNSLGLASHPALRAAAKDAVDRYGVGSGASRLIAGNMEPHEKLEKEIASFMESEGALFFPSGYQANIGAIPVLADSYGVEITDRGGVILSDELNHASLIDGIRLARAECRIYPHNDVSALKRLLEEIDADSPVLVVTEALFSMEGDRAPLAEIAALKEVRPFLLYVDEAHSIGATGPSGRGLAADAECGKSVDIILGTLGKAFGVSGAFIAASEAVVELLINRARPFIYTTAPPPAVAAAALAALEMVRRGDEARERLRRNNARFRELLSGFLGEMPPGRDHIVPVHCPGAGNVMEACSRLLEKGIFCQGIRPPTVPAGKCRLRFSLSALHTDDHLEKTAALLRSDDLARFFSEADSAG